MSSNKVCLAICDTWQCETPLEDSSVRAHLFFPRQIQQRRGHLGVEAVCPDCEEQAVPHGPGQVSPDQRAR